MFLIKTSDGEQQLVNSLDGYDGCEVLNPAFSLPPSDFCEVVDGKWVEDGAAKALAESDAAIDGAGTVGRFQELEARIAELEGMMMVLAPAMEAQLGISLEESNDGVI